MNNLSSNRCVRILLPYFFVFSVIIDSINGYLKVLTHVNTPIGILYRLSVICIVFFLMRKRIQTWGLFLVVGSSFLFLIFCWSTIYNADVIVELNTLIRTLYIPIFICFFALNYEHFNQRKILRQIRLSGLLISTIIIICYIFNIGIQSHEGQYGFGSKGLFNAGNDTGMTIVYILVLSIYYYLKYSSSIVDLFYCLVLTMGGIFIGTRVGLILCLVIFITFIMYVFFQGKLIHGCLIKFLIGGLLLLLPTLYYYLIDLFDMYTLAKFSLEGMASARADLYEAASDYIASFDVLSSIIGKGMSPLLWHVSKFVGSDEEERGVEADWHESIGAYGYILGGVIILFYVYFLWLSVINILKYYNKESLMLLFLSFMFVVLAFFVGHAFRNMMIAPVYGYVAAMIYRGRVIRLHKKSHC